MNTKKIISIALLLLTIFIKITTTKPLPPSEARRIRFKELITSEEELAPVTDNSRAVSSIEANIKNMVNAGKKAIFWIGNLIVKGVNSVFGQKEMKEVREVRLSIQEQLEILEKISL